MKAEKVLDYLNGQKDAIQALVDELDEIQVAFNAQFDAFKANHDRTLGEVTEQVFIRSHSHDKDAVGPALRSAITARLQEEQQQLEERRHKVRDEYLPQRRQAADDLLSKAQAELAQIRTLNPQLDQEEEDLKRQKAALERQLEGLNQEIRQKSRGLGVVANFLAITRADRERHRVLGKLEAVGESLYQVRKRWDEERKQIEERQEVYQQNWQLESIATARLQSELDQLDDDTIRNDLAQRRAIRHVLDHLEAVEPGGDVELDTMLRQMVDLNIQTDAYQHALATVAGLIALLRGIQGGLEAVGKSVDGLLREQQMHSAYLRPLDFQLPEGVDAFHSQWPALRKQFLDEVTVGAHPADFAAQVETLLQGPLAEDSVRSMFEALGAMVERAAAQW